jgi:glycosyltransferase involved in cell wall biosynthesis
LQLISISIVLPLYKPDLGYFSQLIESVSKQNYKNFELIISDDDDSELLVSKVLSKYSDITFKYIKNLSERGIFSNLNNAIKHSKGKYIQICCQDDLMYAEFLGSQAYNLSLHSKAALIFSNFDSIDQSNIIRPLEKRHDIRNTWPSYIPPEKITNYLLAYGCMPGNLSPVMVKREVFDIVGLFDQNYSFAGDFEFWARCSINYAFVYSIIPQIAIRRHDSQASRQLSPIVLQEDYNRIYRFLMLNNTIRRSKFQLKLYINQCIGTQLLYSVVKRFRFFSRKEILHLLRSFDEPFSFTFSAVLIILTLNGRFPLVTINAKDL